MGKSAGKSAGKSTEIPYQKPQAIRRETPYQKPLSKTPQAKTPQAKTLAPTEE